MKLFAKIQDRESFHEERVVLCQFKNEEGEKVFIEEVDKFTDKMFKVLLDTGYTKQEYYYPINRFTISELSIYE